MSNYKLESCLQFDEQDPYTTVALFPWTMSDLKSVWRNYPQCNKDKWENMIRAYSDCAIVAARGRIFDNVKHPPQVEIIRNTTKPTEVISIQIPFNKNTKDPRDHPAACNVAISWALLKDPIPSPVVVFSVGSILYVYQISKRKIVGQLRGHGGIITSIAVDPKTPSTMATCSRDLTTRIYDLLLSPMTKPRNPHWPPGTSPSFGGSAHGLQPSESEGYGIGRCTIVLVGNRSGGHRGAVLCAAFHPTLPLIATGGVDRAIKIWRVPFPKDDSIGREDKPIFSSSVLHSSRILSVSWLNLNTLISHCAPTRQRNGGPLLPGTVVVWEARSLQRFEDPEILQTSVVSTSVSDYTESSSLQILSTTEIDEEVDREDNLSCLFTHCAFASPPLALLLSRKRLRILKVSDMRPEKTMYHVQHALNIEDEKRKLWGVVQTDNTNTVGNTQHSTLELPGETEECFLACAMNIAGSTIVVTGSHGSIWTYKRTT